MSAPRNGHALTSYPVQIVMPSDSIKVDPQLTQQDHIVLRSLLHDIDNGSTAQSTDAASHDEASIELLASLNDPSSPSFVPTITTNWDFKPPYMNTLLRCYAQWATTVVRRPTDVVFLTHILLYLSTSVPSALYLYYNFTYPHAILHWLMQTYYCGAWTLLLHNHIHNNGTLAPGHAWLDTAFPYVLSPLMGHTWNSYYYHHVKMHHVEGNGPEDLSSTVRYQRDSPLDFSIYVGRFLFLIWIELPLYFLRTGKTSLAIKSFFTEMANYLAIHVLLTRVSFGATMAVFLIPLLQMRVGMMVGNWGQHAFVDKDDPKSDFRSSITLIDVASNRHCFNDGYHTSHHLNPRRHWRDHPASFLTQKARYSSEDALVFTNIDYLFITFKLMARDYDHLADCLVPIGDQIGMSKREIAEMLRSKTARFSKEDIGRLWHGKEKSKVDRTMKIRTAAKTRDLRSTLLYFWEG
ncbi:hypothetical protein B0A49_05557 [Cryomyces minteri]|uniref:Fatty acid desaturase domain-containing protein n=1 Tax=Cryomyces minteri TaxID=331657 RepID=A0A4U0XK97_9PEZI|nr:hypothetical protein B0A49_05557 [Cryomyces minteri]